MANVTINDKGAEASPPSSAYVLFQNGTTSAGTTEKVLIGALGSTNLVSVNTDADFGTASGGVITLQSKTYLINTPITTANRLVIPNGVYPKIRASSPLGSITFTGSGTFITVEAGSYGVALEFATFVNTGSGTLFSCNPGATGIFTWFTGQAQGWASLGSISSGLVNFNTVVCSLNSQGISVSGLTTGAFSRMNFLNNNNTANFKMINISGTNGNIQINDNAFKTAGANEACLNIDSGIVTTGISLNGNVFDTSSGGNNFFAGSLTETSPYVTATGNAGLAPSSTHIETSRTGAPTAVTFTVANELVIPQIAGFTTAESERMTSDTYGVLSYTGLSSGRVLKSDSTIMMAPNSGTKTLGIKCLEISGTSKTCTFTNATETVNSTAHGYSNGDMITFYDSSGTMPTGLTKNNVYYVITSATNTFQVSYTSGGSAVAFTTDGSGTIIAKKCTEHGTDTLSIASTTPTNVPSSNLISVNLSSKVAYAVFNATDNVSALITTQKFVELPTK